MSAFPESGRCIAPVRTGKMCQKEKFASPNGGTLTWEKTAWQECALEHEQVKQFACDQSRLRP
jgi:hypothetical protein